MSKNYNNHISPTGAVTIVTVFLLGLGYLLYQSSPQNQNQASAGGDPMHAGSAMATNTKALDALIGKPLPDIQLSDANGRVITASDFVGKYTVLFFNEGLMCYPACWNQMALFGSDQRFNNDQIQAISVVVDTAKDWQTAIDKMPQLAKAVTMFDANAKTSRRLGLLTTASSMHRGSLPGHTYVVLDKEAVVRYVFDDPNMAIANDMLFGKIEELK